MDGLHILKGLALYMKLVNVIHVETCRLRLVTQACSTRLLVIKMCLLLVAFEHDRIDDIYCLHPSSASFSSLVSKYVYQVDRGGQQRATCSGAALHFRQCSGSAPTYFK